MRFLSLASLFAVLPLATLSGCGGGDGNPDSGGYTEAGGGDTVPPDAGDTLTASNPTSSTVDLTWTAATDSVTAAANLEYRVYFSLTNIDSLGDVTNNGIAASDWQANLTALTVESLALDTTYYFNVIVRDEAGNTAVYGGASATTLGGAWQAEEPLEDYTGGSVYYSALAVGPAGDVVAFWSQQPTWEAHFATRASGAATFGDAVAWSAGGISTPAIAFGFDGRPMAASVRINGDATSDVLFGSYTEGTGTTFDEVATGLDSNFTRQARACVAENGDVMVVWLDGTASSTYSLRARFRTGTTWGTTSLLSVTEGLDLYGLDVVCSPDGSHVVLYGQDNGIDNLLNARVYDANLDAWDAAPVPLNEYSYNYTVKTARAAGGRVVVAWEEYDGTGMAIYYRARTHIGSTWSTPAATLADNTVVSIGGLTLAAAGDGDVHAVWRAGTQFVTRRLAAGTTTWSPETPLETVAAVQEFCVAGDPVGGLLLAWTANNAVDAQLYSPAAGTWGAVTPLHTAGESIGSGSLACVLDPQRRASVVWTVWDPVAGQYSAFARTYR